eukprot:6491342-Amphidinium_carterae.2
MILRERSERRERRGVLKAVVRRCASLEDADEVWRSDREVVLTAVQHDGRALQFAAEALKGDREIVLAAVQEYGYALKHATEALRADLEIALAAVQQNRYALEYAADCLLEDPTFAMEAKRHFYLLKFTMLSGRSTVVLALGSCCVRSVLARRRNRLGLSGDGTTTELWRGSERVPDDGTDVEDWPGIQPPGEISEYQLLVRR